MATKAPEAPVMHAVAGGWVHAVWIVSLIALILIFVFGSEALRRRVGDIYFVRTLLLLAVAFAMMAIAGLLAFIGIRAHPTLTSG